MISNRVVKSNALIESSYAMTLTGHRVLSLVCAQKESKLGIEITARDMGEVFGVNTRSICAQLLKAEKHLRALEFVLDHWSDTPNVFAAFSSVDYLRGKGILKLNVSPQLAEHIFDLQGKYTSYHLSNVAKFTSSYAFRFYEMLAQWRIAGKRKITIQFIRDAMLLNDKYSLFTNLDRNVINPSLYQIQKYSGLDVSYKWCKRGRDIKAIDFSFKGTKNANPDPNSPEFLWSFIWKKIRFEAIKLHGQRCMCCGASVFDGATLNVDHILPRRTHPELALDINNLQVLCGDCNHGKGNWDTTDFRVGRENRIT